MITHAAGVNYRSFATRERAQCQSECEADARCAPSLSGIGPRWGGPKWGGLSGNRLRDHPSASKRVRKGKEGR